MGGTYSTQDGTKKFIDFCFKDPNGRNLTEDLGVDGRSIRTT
jgi:hypothetical protein